MTAFFTLFIVISLFLCKFITVYYLIYIYYYSDLLKTEKTKKNISISQLCKKKNTQITKKVRFCGDACALR